MAPLYWLTLGLFLAPTFAAPVTTRPGPTCVDGADNGELYSADNADWRIDCNLDFWGGDIATGTFDTFEKCIKACDALTGCISVAYVGDQCYQKGTLAATSTPQENCWTARQIRAGGEETPEVEETAPAFSCVNNKDNGKLYPTTKGVFEIVCGKDFGGNDISSTSAESFEKCIDACSATTGCVNVAFVWGACYLKNKSGPVSNAESVWSAKLQAPVVNELSCIDNKDNNSDFATPQGTYHIECGIDFAGNDISTVQVDNFEACITRCSQIAECNTVSFVQGACYLKNKKGNSVPLGHVWGASRGNAAETPTTPVVTGLSCINKKDDTKTYNSPSGGQYLIQCGVDFAGGDFSSSEEATFEACIAACDQKTECIDVSYVNGHCYLKNTLITPALELEHVWTAKRIGSAVVSTSSTSVTTTTSSSTASTVSTATSTISTTSSTLSTTTSVPTSTTTSTTTSSTTSTTTTTSGVSVPTSLTCPTVPGASYSDGVNDWEIRCGVDYPFNDMASNNSPTFAACIASCASLSGCIGTTWISTGPTPALAAQGSASCYLKSAIGAARGANLPWSGPPLVAAILKNPFKILSVIYSTLDVTAEATASWTQGSKLVINNDALAYLKNDPWYLVVKSVTMLYSHKGELRIYIGSDWLGTVTISPGAVSNHIGSTVVPNFPQTNGVTDIKIVAASWGNAPVALPPPISRMYQSYKLGTKWVWDQSSMVGNTPATSFSSTTKTGVIWYRGTASDNLYYITGRERADSTWIRPT